MSNKDLVRQEINRLLDRPIDDEKKVLEIIVQAITRKYANPELVEQAVRQAVYNYETQMRIFQIATAKRQLARIVRLMDITEQMEHIVMDPKYMAAMEPKDLIALYGKAQASVKEGLDYIKKVVDARIEAQAAQAAMMATINQRDVEQADIGNIAALSSQQRDKVRRIVSGIVDNIIDIGKGDVSILEDADMILPPKGNKGGNGVG